MKWGKAFFQQLIAPWLVYIGAIGTGVGCQMTLESFHESGVLGGLLGLVFEIFWVGLFLALIIHASQIPFTQMTKSWLALFSKESLPPQKEGTIPVSAILVGGAITVGGGFLLGLAAVGIRYRFVAISSFLVALFGLFFLLGQIIPIIVSRNRQHQRNPTSRGESAKAMNLYGDRFFALFIVAIFSVLMASGITEFTQDRLFDKPYRPLILEDPQYFEKGEIAWIEAKMGQRIEIRVSDKQRFEVKLPSGMSIQPTCTDSKDFETNYACPVEVTETGRYEIPSKNGTTIWYRRTH